MKNQYNVIKEKLEQGFFVLVKDLGNAECETPYNLFTHLYRDGNSLKCSAWVETRELALDPYNINNFLYTEQRLREFDLEIVEYFRPNDLFPSKRFEAGDRVEVKLTNWSTDPRREMLSVALTKDWVVESIDAHSGHLYYTLYSTSQGNTCYLSALHVYPKTEKQEEKKVEDIIGEASKKALEAAGYVINKK